MTFDSSATIRVNSSQITELTSMMGGDETASAIRTAIQFYIDHSGSVFSVFGKVGSSFTIPGLLDAMRAANIKKLPTDRAIRYWCEKETIVATKAHGGNDWIIPWNEAMKIITARLPKPTVSRMN